jgi:hypothetical protein
MKKGKKMMSFADIMEVNPEMAATIAKMLSGAVDLLGRGKGKKDYLKVAELCWEILEKHGAENIVEILENFAQIRLMEMQENFKEEDSLSEMFNKENVEKL